MLTLVFYSANPSAKKIKVHKCFEKKIFSKIRLTDLFVYSGLKTVDFPELAKLNQITNNAKEFHEK